MSADYKNGYLHGQLAKALLEIGWPLDSAAALRERQLCAPALLDTDSICRHKFNHLWDSAWLPGPVGRVEQDFFQSASYLQALYDLPAAPTTCRPFPENLLYAHKYLERALTAANPGLSLLVTKTPDGKVCLATRRIYGSAGYVYFLEIAYLCRYLRIYGNDPTACLLLSIFSYLLKVVDMPYYTDNDSYVNYQYESTLNCITEDEYNDPSSPRKLKAHYQRIMKAGRSLKKVLLQPCHLERFKERIKSASGSGQVCPKLLAIAKRAYKIYEKFPATSIFAGRFTHSDTEEDEDNIVTFEQSFSFLWECEPCPIYDYLREYLSCEYGEKPYSQQPEAIQIFNSPQTGKTAGLSFATAVMELIADLIYFLNYNL